MRTWRIRAFGALILGICCCFSGLGISFAETLAPGASLEAIQARGVLRGGLPNFRLYPFIFWDEGEPRGLDADLLSEIAQALGVELEYVPLKWQGGVELAWTPGYAWDRFDLVAGSISITEKRKEVCDFSDPYFASGQVVSVLGNSGIYAPQQLKDKRIVTPEGTTSEQVARGYFSRGTVIVLPGIPECYKALMEGRADGAVTDFAPLLLEPWVQNGEIVILPKALSREWYGVALPKNRPRLMELVNRVIQEQKDVLRARWMHDM